MDSLGQKLTEKSLQYMLEQVDVGPNDTIQFDEFLHVMTRTVIDQDAWERAAFSGYDDDCDSDLDYEYYGSEDAVKSISTVPFVPQERAWFDILFT
jgi:Ca2+-binding EF-hand superfamily protein